MTVTATSFIQTKINALQSQLDQPSPELVKRYKYIDENKKTLSLMQPLADSISSFSFDLIAIVASYAREESI